MAVQEGALRGISMQAYEAHIPYLLQFTTDFNIAPMGWMNLRTAKVLTSHTFLLYLILNNNAFYLLLVIGAVPSAAAP